VSPRTCAAGRNPGRPPRLVINPNRISVIASGPLPRLLEWAEAIGPFTLRLVEAMLINKPHPEAGYRAAMGLRPLANQYGDQRLEAAATRAMRANLCDAGGGIRGAGDSRQHPRRRLLQRRQ